jgi:uncharacterized membrane protein YgdD (TMEM256/DUF423 family)
VDRQLVAVAGILGFLAVALGAFGSHGLRSRVDARSLEVWQTAVQYHLAHTLAILLVAILAAALPAVRKTAWLFVAGIAVFSGSLYLMVLTGTRWLGAITPIGGVLFLLGWAWLAWTPTRERGL